MKTTSCAPRLQSQYSTTLDTPLHCSAHPTFKFRKGSDMRCAVLCTT
ncbi:hypothetical protein M3J09_007790 [Ascochyta lentis]